MIKPLFLKITKKIGVFFLISTFFILNSYLISPKPVYAVHPGSDPSKTISPGSGTLKAGESLDIFFRVPGALSDSPQKADIMLVLDNSGSMNADFEGCFPGDLFCTFNAPAKKDAAKAALLNFISRADSTFDQIGLTTFRTSVATPQTLTTDFSVALESAISGVLTPAFGGTSIGNGVWEAWEELNSDNARPEARKYIILATDGLQNHFTSIGDSRSIYTDVTIVEDDIAVTHTVLEWLELSGVKVFTIAVGAAATAALQSGTYCNDTVPVGGLNYCPTEIDTGQKYLQDLSCRTNRDPVDPGDPSQVSGVPNWPRNCTDPTQSDPNLPGFNNYFFAPNDEDLDDVYETIQDIIGRDMFVGLVDQLNDSVFETLPSGAVDATLVSLVQIPHNVLTSPPSSCSLDPPLTPTPVDPSLYFFNPEHDLDPGPGEELVFVVLFGRIPDGFDYCVTINVTVSDSAPVSATPVKVDNDPTSISVSPYNDPTFNQACYVLYVDFVTGDLEFPTKCSPQPEITILPSFEPWIQTEEGDVGVYDGSEAVIKVERGPNFGKALTGGQTHSDFLVTIEGNNQNSDNFTSARDWLVEGYPSFDSTSLEASVNIYESLNTLYSSRGIDDVNLSASNNIFSVISSAANSSLSDILIEIGDVEFGDPANYTGDPAVVFIDGNLNITDRVLINSDTGLVFIVSGNIVIDGSVTEIDGFYIANGIFDSGSSSNQLEINGSVLAFGGVDVKDKRSFGSADCSSGFCNEDNPSEYFRYEPKYLYLLRDIAGIAVETFRELAP